VATVGRFAATQKFRDVTRTGRAAFVVDDVLEPFQPRGIEVRGHADTVRGPQPAIRIHPERVIGWGLDGAGRHARSIARHTGEPQP
jgi:pyridoxamine 5'-phosphate oxidase family protein